MRVVSAVSFGFLLCLVSGCTYSVNDSGDARAIKDLVAEMQKQTNAGQVPEFVASYYTNDAVRLPPNEPPVTQLDAIRASAQAHEARFVTEQQTASVVSVLSSGNLAVARGIYDWARTPAASGLAAATERGKWIAVFQRQPGGTWKCVYDIWNSNLPAPGASPGGVEEEALFQTERDWAEATLKKDVAVVERILDDEFVASVNGVVRDKKQTLAELAQRTAPPDSGANSEMRAAVFGDTGAVHGLYTRKGAGQGQGALTKLRYTEIFVKRDGRWRCVSQHIVTVP